MAQINQNVLFYLRGDSFLDLSPDPVTTINNINNATINYNEGPSFYFDGSSSYLNVTGLDFNTILSGDYTLEYEVKHVSVIQSYPTPLAIVNGTGSDTNYRSLYTHWFADSVWFRDVNFINGTTTHSGVSLNTWYHIAVVKEGTNLRTYLNGNLLFTKSTTSNYYVDSDNMCIGTCGSGTSDYFNGYVKNIRLLEGVKYSSNFTPSFETDTSLSIDNMQCSGNVLSFSVNKTSINENITKVDILVNNEVIQTYTEGFNNISYDLSSTINNSLENIVEVRAYYSDSLYISDSMNVYHTLDKIDSEVNLSVISNKLVELKNFYISLNTDIYNHLINEGIEVNEGDKKITRLIDLMKGSNVAYIEEINTLNSTITSKDNEINTLNSTITSKNNEINTLKNTLSQFAAQFASYTVSAISGASYGFSLSSGYYESQNKGVNSSYAICKVTITNPYGANVYMDYINYAEANYDFGLVSNLNTPLSLSTTADSSNVLLNCKGNSSSTMKTLDLGKVEGYYYVKFRKDNSTSSYNDSFKFIIRFA